MRCHAVPLIELAHQEVWTTRPYGACTLCSPSPGSPMTERVVGYGACQHLASSPSCPLLAAPFVELTRPSRAVPFVRSLSFPDDRPRLVCAQSYLMSALGSATRGGGYKAGPGITGPGVTNGRSTRMGLYVHMSMDESILVQSGCVTLAGRPRSALLSQ